jgi:glutamate-1-semialdehyde 2,1-aminomutase
MVSLSQAQAWAVEVLLIVATVVASRQLYRRVQLSLAKHPSLQGHARIAQLVARLLPYYEFTGERFFQSDGPPADVAAARQESLAHLAAGFEGRSPRTLEATRRLAEDVSDLRFTAAYAVPFPFRRYLNEHLTVGAVLSGSNGVCVTDLDGHPAFDLSGSYGVNVLGYDFYKRCIDAGVARVRALGPVLGAYHPIVQDNVTRLRAISGLDEVSFHMSGTEAVMQAVRLARFHTRRSHLVRFAGAYHGWWDDVQPGIGNPTVPRATYTLRDMDRRTIDVLATRKDIACVLVNPLQALHPNRPAPGDGTLIAGRREAGVDRGAYAGWLRDLRAVCDYRGIALIFDEVFVGFRLAAGGAQEYFDVEADLVTYGKTVGGGLPIGVLCGRRSLMQRYRADRPSDLCFARGTFNAHPCVMGTMNEFLRALDAPAIRASYDAADALWNERIIRFNERLRREDLPVVIANLGSICTVLYRVPSRYNWMLQFYLRDQGLRLSWVGTGRLIFSHNYTDAEFDAVVERFAAGARAMRDAGWWWAAPSRSNGAIQRQMVREMVSARWRRHAA